MAEAKQQSRKKKFIKDFGVYSIGVLGSKLITFLMVPFYTYFIVDPKEYGYYDLSLQACLLLSPLVTIQLKDGAFRHLLVSNNDDEKRKIITFCINTLCGSISVILSISLLIFLIHPIKHLQYITAMLIVMAMCDVLLHILRGLGNNKAFVTANLISTVTTAIFSIIFVAFLSFGIKGIFLASTLSRILALIYSEYTQRIFSYYTRDIDIKAIGKELIKYCLPLIPVSVCWWLTSSLNRFFVKEFLGLEITGVYAVAVRLAGILQTLGIIFYQTWQENAIQQYNSPDRDRFFSKVFNSYLTILSFLFIYYIFTLKLCYGWIVSGGYQKGMEYLYLMGITTFFHTLTTYFDLGYQCAKETKRAIKSVFLTALLSITLNFTLIKPLGIYGVIISSLTSYLFLLIYRYFDTRRYFKVSIKKNTIIHLALMLVGGIIYMKKVPIWGDLLFMIGALVVYVKTIPLKQITTLVSSKLSHSHK